MSVTSEPNAKRKTWRQAGIKGDIQAAQNAFRGLFYMFRTQRPFWIQVLLSGLYAGVALLRGISATEWVFSGVVVVVIWILEIVNTAIEKVCDFVYPDHHEEIGVIKDLAASAVLMMVLLAGMLSVIFLSWPHLI